MRQAGPNDAGLQVAAWGALYPILRQCGEIAVRECGGQNVEDSLSRLAMNPSFGAHRSDRPDPAVGSDLRLRVNSILERCRAEITTPVPSKRHDDEAVLCWWSHVTSGYPIKAVPSSLKDHDGQPLLAGRWSNPDKTVRERMWTAAEWRSPKVTWGALNGYSRIVKRWEEEFGVTLEMGLRLR